MSSPENKPFKDIETLFAEDGDSIAEIENQPGYERHFGKIWIQGGWLERQDAIRLREWLNEALS